MDYLIRMHQFANEVRKQLSTQRLRTSNAAYAQMEAMQASPKASSTAMNGARFRAGRTSVR
jgi:hypothetical protein